MGRDPPFTPKIVIPGCTAGGVSALWVSEDPPRRMHIGYNITLQVDIVGTVKVNIVTLYKWI